MPQTALHPDGPSSPAAGHPAVVAFMNDLRTLRTENGAPSYATLSNRAGLPRSTVYDALRRDRLPALSTALALVQALGADPVAWRRRWTEARAQVETGQRPETSSEPLVRTAVESVRTNSDAAGRPRRRPRRWLLAGALVVVLLGGGIITYLVWPSGSHCRRAQLYTVTSAGDLLNASGQTVGTTQTGDTIEVFSHRHAPFLHRLQGTLERTGITGYIDEARIDPARTVCG